jgi:hypothetical protein
MLRKLVLGVLLASSALLAQDTGSLYGTVTDPNGAAVPNARVTATSVERGNVRTATSNALGEWTLTLMPLGGYNIRVEAQGFKAFDQKAVALALDQNVKIDARLEIGATSDTITVTAEAPLVDSRSSALGANVESAVIQEMPMNGRNIFDMATLLPGISSVSDPQTFTNDRQGPTYTTSGSRTADNLMLFDGSTYVALFRNTGLNYPPPDAIQEVHIRTSNFTAEFGRNSGTAMNVVTKSGTNQYHGSGWEYFRNGALNARTFFAKTVNKLVQNQYGGTGGGPLKKNKLFFFASYQGLKVRTAALSSSAKPLTSNESNGIFSSKITDPLNNNTPFASNTIPSFRFDPIAVKLNQLIQPANSANGTLVATYAAPQDDDQGLIRADYYAGRHAIDARYNEVYSRDQKSSGNVPSYERIGDDTWYHTASIGDTLPISPTLLNVTRLAYNRFGGTVSVLTPYSLHSLGSLLPEFGPPTPSEINVSSRFDIGNTSAAPAILVNQSIDLSESISWIHGAHTFKGGIQYLRLQYLNRSFFQTQGGFTFSGIFTGNSAADFLLGTAQTLAISAPALEQAGKQNSLYSYFQDDWRISRRLTLNLGLRYELPFPWYQPNDWWGSFIPGEKSTVYPTAPTGLVFPGDPGVPRGLVPTPSHNFAPRLGFAWDTFGDGKTAVRGGFGVFYNAITSNIIQNGTQPFRYSYTINAPYSLVDPLRGYGAIPNYVTAVNPVFTLNPPPQLVFPSPSLSTPYTVQYNLTVQRQIVRDLVLETAYVGKLGRKLLTDISYNPAIYATGATVANENSRVLYPGFGNITMMGTFANSDYNALQVRVMKRLSRGFMVTGTYTFSKSMDESSSSVTDTAAIPNPFNLHSEWGLSDFYAKHIASFAGTWNMPKLLHHNVFVREGLGGWNLSMRFTSRTGNPLNIVTGADNAFSGTPKQRPNVTGDPVLSTDRTRAQMVAQWFDPTVFAAPTGGTYGNLGRNALIGPGMSSTNAALLKNFPFSHRENVYVQFRLEAFSLFNMPIFSNPGTTMGSSLGKITSASGDRELQLATKIVF